MGPSPACSTATPCFPTNSVLPVSPYYPGLELATAATRWLTGLPLVLDQLIVLAAVRIVLVLGVFLVVERACHSSRAGGIGVLVYAASPQFYGFDAQYAYETIALAFAVAVVYLLFVSIDSARPRMGRSFALALGCVGGGGPQPPCHRLAHRRFPRRVGRWAVPHGPPSPSPALTGWGPAWPSPRPRRRSLRHLRAWRSGMHRANASSMPDLELHEQEEGPGPHRRDRRRGRTRHRRRLDLVRRSTPHPVPRTCLRGRVGRHQRGIGHRSRGPDALQERRGWRIPHWEIAPHPGVCHRLGASILVPSLFSVIFKRSVRGGALRYLPAVIAAIYPISVLPTSRRAASWWPSAPRPSSSSASQLVVGAWLARRISRDRRLIERVATIGVATVVFLGSLLFGIGPLVSLLPGPYRVGADNLSLWLPLAGGRPLGRHPPAGGVPRCGRQGQRRAAQRHRRRRSR